METGGSLELANHRVPESLSEMTLKIRWRLIEECLQYVHACMTTCTHMYTRVRTHTHTDA